MLVIKNSAGETFCSPATNEPYRFETEEDAAYMIVGFGLYDVHIVDENAEWKQPPEEKELRYGGQDDLW